jgi:hypothetical protein
MLELFKILYQFSTIKKVNEDFVTQILKINMPVPDYLPYHKLAYK